MEDQIPYAGEMLGATLFLVGLVVSWVVWRRRGAAHGLRGVAWSLALLAAGLVGLLESLWIFFSGLNIFSPVLWAGGIAIGLAVVLYVVSGIMKARGVGTKGKVGGRKSAKAAEGQGSGKGQVESAKASDDEDDFSDIEAILRDRGIT